MREYKAIINIVCYIYVTHELRMKAKHVSNTLLFFIDQKTSHYSYNIDFYVATFDIVNFRFFLKIKWHKVNYVTIVCFNNNKKTFFGIQDFILQAYKKNKVACNLGTLFG